MKLNVALWVMAQVPFVCCSRPCPSHDLPVFPFWFFPHSDRVGCVLSSSSWRQHGAGGCLCFVTYTVIWTGIVHFFPSHISRLRSIFNKKNINSTQKQSHPLWSAQSHLQKAHCRYKWLNTTHYNDSAFLVELQHPIQWPYSWKSDVGKTKILSKVQAWQVMYLLGSFFILLKYFDRS